MIRRYNLVVADLAARYFILLVPLVFWGKGKRWSATYASEDNGPGELTEMDRLGVERGDASSSHWLLEASVTFASHIQYKIKRRRRDDKVYRIDYLTRNIQLVLEYNRHFTQALALPKTMSGKVLMNIKFVAKEVYWKSSRRSDVFLMASFLSTLFQSWKQEHLHNKLYNVCISQ